MDTSKIKLKFKNDIEKWNLIRGILPKLEESDLEVIANAPLEVSMSEREGVVIRPLNGGIIKYVEFMGIILDGRDVPYVDIFYEDQRNAMRYRFVFRN